MRHVITIEIETPEEASLFESVKQYTNALGAAYSTSARFEIGTLTTGESETEDVF